MKTHLSGNLIRLTAIIAVVMTMLTASIQYAHADPGWGTNWEYRMLIEITDTSGSALTNYQVPIVIDNTTFDYSKAQPDGDDIRFGTASGTDCDYWIEEWNTTGESTIWVEIPSIPASGTTSIYMYYGNPAAASASNGAATFDFFDDFEDGDISDWSSYSSGTVQIANDGGNYVLLKTTSNDPNGGYSLFNNGALSTFEAVFETKRINENGGTQNRYGIEDGSFNGYGPRMYDFNTLPSNFAIERRTGGTGSNLVSKTTSSYEWDTWMTVIFRAYAGNVEFELYGSSGALVESISASDSTYSSFDRFVVHGGYEFYTDDIRVRKYTSSEPTVNLGQEETDNSIMDYFGGTTGVSASSNVDVSNGEVKLELSAIEQTAFSDSFESDLSNWNENGATAWDLETDRYYDDSHSIKASNGDEGYIISDDIDLSDATAATIDFWFNKDDTEGEDFTLYFYDGASWNLISELDSLGGDDVWLNYDDVYIDISTYGISTFRIRFDATLGWGENVWVDQLTVTKTTEQYSSEGSLTSISISPANLQSWGQFTACDNMEFCLPYRKPISITGTGTALTNYQISVPVTYVAGKMNADFSDLRFKDSSDNILSYWIESYVASTSAQAWVKVPSIAASGITTIYMYYGSATATSASNGVVTFIFFDDFSGDLSKWTKHVNGANINIVSGYLECVGGTTAAPYGHTVLGSSASYSSFTDGIIDGKVYLATDGIAEVGYRGSYAANTGYKSRMDARAGQGLGHLMPPYSGWGFIPTGGGPSGTAIPTGTWYPFSIIANGSSLNISCAGQTLIGTDTSYAGPGEISLQNHYGTYSRFDDIRVRKYASSEPIVNTGSEESGSYCGFTNPGAVTSITYKILNAADDSVLCTITAAQAAAGYNIASCAGSATSIKLRAELSTSNPSQTPILYDWKITWTSVIPVTIDITAPGDISSWDLYPGITNNISGTLNVAVSPSSTGWYVTAQDIDAVNTNGFMTLWEGSSYNTSVKLTYAMNVAGSAEVTLPGGGTIASGTGNYSGTITFKQFVSWDDDPGTYQIVVTFIGTTN